MVKWLAKGLQLEHKRAQLLQSDCWVGLLFLMVTVWSQTHLPSLQIMERLFVAGFSFTE